VRGWIGVDLDGTLAQYDGWSRADHIGDPVWPMVDRVRGWLGEGHDVRIFTARVSSDGSPGRDEDARIAREAIVAWCKRWFLRELPITNVKDYGLVVLFDDRCVQVTPNTGALVGALPAVLS
jgi:hypothetical protein